MNVKARLDAVADKYGVLPNHLLEAWSERAAIREYLGGMPRAQAELEAVYDACELLGLLERTGFVSATKDATIVCQACTAGLPLVWHVQSRKTMHLAQGLSVVSCKRLDAREQRARDTASDRGNEDQRGR